ncbi:hypothetical protein OHB56_22095 [Streptomyces sp. NBC_01635]|uniref:hypothetical protein n=1 Tax=Streptomyces sp. NBC_01635 TaxID=2975904 RepID=UPI00386D3018|nr:hypothetical protein OHB56_22095 [Streptomyces sp. NBC_01635]
MTSDPGSLYDLGLEDHVIEVVLQAPVEDVARMREVPPRILEYGRPDACPGLIMV